MNPPERNNRSPFEDNVLKSVKQLAIDPKKTPRKILTRSKMEKPEEKIEEKYFLLKGKQKLLAHKNQIQNEIIQSKALEPLINEKILLTKIKSELNEEKESKKNQNSKNKLSSKNFKEGDFYGNLNTPISSNLLHKDNLKKEEKNSKRDKHTRKEEKVVDKYEILNNNEKFDEINDLTKNSKPSDNQVGKTSKTKFGTEKKFLYNFPHIFSNTYHIISEDKNDQEEIPTDIATSTSKAKIRNSHLITDTGCQSKIKSYFKESKPRSNQSKCKNKLASKRKQEELTQSEEEQIKMSHKKKKIFR